VDECHRQGIKIFLYYSLLDWHHPDFVFHKDDGGVYHHQIPHPRRDEQKYIQYMENQLTELLTNYGRIDGIWFDGYWSKNTSRWPFEKIYGLIHKLQPACMIGNNHDMFYIPGEDYAVYALYDPFPQADYDKDPRLKDIPLEAMDKSSDKWGYYSKQVYKPVDTLINNIKKVAVRHATFLLNTGPLPDGTLDPHFTDIMGAVHDRMTKNKGKNYP
jgi:alpha-L-fucosidase